MSDKIKILGSNMSTQPDLKDDKSGYGQGGFSGASSDLPGEKTSSNFLPQGNVPSGDWQTRNVSDTEYAPAHGLKHRDDHCDIGADKHPVTRR